MATTSRKTKTNSEVGIAEAVIVVIVLGAIVLLLSALPYLIGFNY